MRPSKKQILDKIQEKINNSWKNGKMIVDILDIQAIIDCETITELYSRDFNDSIEL